MTVKPRPFAICTECYAASYDLGPSDPYTLQCGERLSPIRSLHGHKTQHPPNTRLDAVRVLHRNRKSKRDRVRRVYWCGLDVYQAGRL